MGISVNHSRAPRAGRRRLARLALRAFPAALVSLALVPAGGSAAGTNLLANGTFEGAGSGSLAGWVGSGANLSLAADGHGGGFAASIAYKGTGGTSAVQSQPRPV